MVSKGCTSQGTPHILGIAGTSAASDPTPTFASPRSWRRRRKILYNFAGFCFRELSKLVDFDNLINRTGFGCFTRFKYLADVGYLPDLADVSLISDISVIAPISEIYFISLISEISLISAISKMSRRAGGRRPDPVAGFPDAAARWRMAFADALAMAACQPRSRRNARDSCRDFADTSSGFVGLQG
jgi:hypothetical protein